MPIYEYECGACSHTFDTLQKFSDAALTKCPKCNEERLRKLISAAAFRLKGGGWYETDFKSGDKKNIAGSDSRDGAGSAEKSASKSGDSAKGATKSEQSGGKGGSDSKKNGEKSTTTSTSGSTKSTASKG